MSQDGEFLFMVGCARSGSTLLQHVLNKSPDICLSPETHFIRRARSLRLEARLATARSMTDLRGVVDSLYEIDSHSRRGGWAWLRRNVPRDTFLERFAETERNERAVFELFMNLYAEWVRPGAGRPRVLGEKTPGHIRHVPQLLEWFPRARILHTFRDPRAIYVSELRRRRQGRWGPKAGLGARAGRIVDPFLGPMQLVHTSVRWSQAARLDHRYARALGDRYMRVRFEDLVANPTAELERVTRFIGVPNDPAMLDIRITGSSYADDRHVGAGFDPAAAERWRAHVGPVPNAWFRAILGSELAAYGYG